MSGKLCVVGNMDIEDNSAFRVVDSANNRSLFKTRLLRENQWWWSMLVPFPQHIVHFLPQISYLNIIKRIKQHAFITIETLIPIYVYFYSLPMTSYL